METRTDVDVRLLPLVATGGYILDPTVDFDPREADLFVRLLQRDALIAAEINLAARQMHDLIRHRRLGRGPDPLWSAEMERLETSIDKLYTAKRKNLLALSGLLASVLRRRKRAARSMARATAIFTTSQSAGE